VAEARRRRGGPAERTPILRLGRWAAQLWRAAARTASWRPNSRATGDLAIAELETAATRKVAAPPVGDATPRSVSTRILCRGSQSLNFAVGIRSSVPQRRAPQLGARWPTADRRTPLRTGLLVKRIVGCNGWRRPEEIRRSRSTNNCEIDSALVGSSSRSFRQRRWVEERARTHSIARPLPGDRS